MTRHQPNTDSNLKNNTKIRPETRPEYSQTHPKPVRSGRVFGWAESIAQSYL